MNTDHIKELIENAKSSSQPEEVLQLIRDFEAFAALYSQKERSTKDADFKEQIFIARDKFLASFNSIAESFGLTSDMIQSYFDNPQHFTEEQWRKMQLIKQEGI